jgi:hypothetical protein
MLRTTTQRSYDAEQGEASSERTAVQSNYLHEESSNTQRKHERHCICTPQLFGGGIYLPDPSTYDPIEILLNTEDDKDRDELTMRWRDNKLSELNFVGVVVGIPGIANPYCYYVYTCIIRLTINFPRPLCSQAF